MLGSRVAGAVASRWFGGQLHRWWALVVVAAQTCTGGAASGLDGVVGVLRIDGVVGVDGAVVSVFREVGCGLKIT